MGWGLVVGVSGLGLGVVRVTKGSRPNTILWDGMDPRTHPQPFRILVSGKENRLGQEANLHLLLFRYGERPYTCDSTFQMTSEGLDRSPRRPRTCTFQCVESIAFRVLGISRSHMRYQVFGVSMLQIERSSTRRKSNPDVMPAVSERFTAS